MKYEIMDELLELMKNSRLNNNQKLKMIDIIKNEKTATQKQKERFMLFYGLNLSGEKDMTLTQLSKMCGCNYGAIKGSIIGMKKKLLRNEEIIQKIEEIVNECKMEVINYAKQNKSSSR